MVGGVDRQVHDGRGLGSAVTAIENGVDLVIQTRGDLGPEVRGCAPPGRSSVELMSGSSSSASSWRATG